MIEEKPKTRGTADERVRQRYPTAYAKVAASFRAKAPNEARPVTAAEIEEATGFITREAVIAEILRAADWSREIAPGRFVSAEERAEERTAAQTRSSSRGSRTADDPFVSLLKRALERETSRNRLGVSAAYLRHFCGNPDPAALGELLDGAPWAVKQFGLYRYAGEPGPDSPSASGENAQLPLDPALTPQRAEPAESDAGPSRMKSTEAPRFEQLSFLPPEREREEVRVGTLLYARENRREKTTAFAVDFGHDIGVKKARVPTADMPAGEPLAGRQVVCRMTYADGELALRILTTDSEDGAAAVIPAVQVANGDRVR